MKWSSNLLQITKFAFLEISETDLAATTVTLRASSLNYIMHLVIRCEDIAWNGIAETFTEGGGFVSNHLGYPLLSAGWSDTLIVKVLASVL